VKSWRSIPKRASPRSLSTTATDGCWPMSATPISAIVARRGTLDMARAVRSPGSALKSFIYAMGFDRLILHPETVLEDRPRHFADYAPADFDGRFQGEVTARESAAIFAQPAGRRGARPARPKPVSRPRLLPRASGMRLPEPTAEPGLAVALGGVGISLADLVRLYAALSNGGEGRGRCAIAPMIRQPEVSRSSGRLPHGMSTTSWPMRRLRPAYCRSKSAAADDLASRPATSYGYRDFWAIGYDRVM